MCDTKVDKRKQDTCADYFDCCDCGGEEGGCGCYYCWSCNACDTCLNSEGDDYSNCELLNKG